MTKRMIIMLLLVSVLFGGVLAAKYQMDKGMNEYLNNMPVPPAAITTAKAEKQSWDEALEGVGTLVAINGADMTTEAGGIVTAIHFESGARVEKGAKLVTLDDATEVAELKRLEAQGQLAELNRQRREKLFKLEAISKSDYDAAVAESAAAKAAIAAQQAKVAQKDIRAPFPGVLGIRQVNLGQYLAAGSAIVTLQQLDPITVDFTLPEQRIGLVQAGQKVSVTVDALPDKPFEGTVLAVEPRIDAGTRNFTVRARLANPKYELRPGQSARVRLGLAKRRDVVVVPRTAVDYNAYGTGVYVVQKKKNPPPRPENPRPDAPAWTDLEVVQRFVKTGEARGDFVVITEGLEPGTEIATSGILKLRNEQGVIVNNTVQPDVKMRPAPPPG
ncbi:MAG TPA: efflux RND transporter periplasmic adaptor subunit [Nevskiaceae bacterium]|nr:efflux RND transporter periplasmic adaptor subunit [Nevskiaceae bacterium]